MTLDLDICMLASLPTVDSQVLPAMNTFLIWAECSNVNNRTIDRLAMPLNDTVNAYVFLM